MSPPVAGPVVPLAFTLNGARVTVLTPPDATLAALLRDQLDQTGTKVGCAMGECGACTVLVDGKPWLACLTLAPKVAGRSVRTIEGMATGETLHPIQEAIVRADALQCGFCTPGQVMAAAALLDDNPSPTRTEVREAMAGNICRCGVYGRLEEAILAAAQTIRKGKSPSTRPGARRRVRDALPDGTRDREGLQEPNRAGGRGRKGIAGHSGTRRQAPARRPRGR